MKKFRLAIILPFLFLFFSGSAFSGTAKPQIKDFNFEAGMSKVDITGPPTGIMFWGYAQEGQKGEGIHLRQFARALVIKDPKTGKVLAYVTAELGGVPHEVQRDVVARLKKEVDQNFNLANVLLNASHTHSAPAGFFHYIQNSIYTTKFFPEYYSVITNGIFQAIKEAYSKREIAQLLIGTGTVEGAGVNRSLVAYQANPKAERDKYNSDTDKTMIQISVNTRRGVIGIVNWFGVHTTSMTFDNHLVSTDNKGYASYLSEFEAAKRGQKDFIAIFAQANEGDVTPNLNLNNTGPGKDMFESTKIIGERQYLASSKILNDDNLRALPSGLNYTQSFIDMPNSIVRKEFSETGKDERTCLSAYGYALAAGSTEEGGGHWLFHEGMKDEDRKFYIDWLAARLLQAPSDELRVCQKPKAILFPMGETKPDPSLSQILPLGLATIGDFALIVSPNEVTTMSSRRMKETVKNVLGSKIKDIALSGLTNDFAGYITTKEEYSTQQYEGGHTLHGPFSLDLFRQEYHRLANDLLQNKISVQGPFPKDLSSTVVGTDVPHRDKISSFDPKIKTPNESIAKTGESVSCEVSSVNPNISYPKQKSYFDVEKKEGDKWITAHTDSSWATKFYYKKSFLPLFDDKIRLIWETDKNDTPGVYRLKHSSFYLNKEGKEVPFSIDCPEFELK
ncbi:neutral/alkaline non-lysosomal ceramidase N-terminal domain-containing protein [Leptospira andrefontaineae]|uniref:Neutral ceramidase n=1 Tax=Leptospira andrefontaineae TaxID=2484976 RepID=A0A4R9H483_9LEPT|nr:neutral/alkaline non-lysosomal ceramidase N-terminal domain-containing protein [Leptospira andrefontaineae]TGK39716.1 ceramidase [Leptospira andrefontaineae]